MSDALEQLRRRQEIERIVDGRLSALHEMLAVVIDVIESVKTDVKIVEGLVTKNTEAIHDQRLQLDYKVAQAAEMLADLRGQLDGVVGKLHLVEVDAGLDAALSQSRQTRLATLQRNLAKLEERKTLYGLDVPLHILNEIEIFEREIERLQDEDAE